MEQPPGGAAQPTRHRPGRHTTRPLVAVASAVALILGVSAVALAVSTLQFGRTDVTVAASPLTFRAFEGAPTDGWPTADAFVVDAASGLRVSAEGLTVAPVGSGLVDGVSEPSPSSPAWWDEAWGLRICETVSHTEVGAADVDGWLHPLSVDLDGLVAAGLLDQDLGDLRAVVDGAEAPLWVDATDPATDQVWVPVGALIAGSAHTVCLYVANPDAADPALRGAEAVFGPSAGRVSDLVALDPDLDGSTGVDVAALWGPTAVAVTPTAAEPDGLSLTLAEVETASISQVELGTIVRADGPLSSRTAAGSALVPVSDAALELSASSAAGDRLTLVAPLGEATVTVSRGSLTLATFTVADGTGRTTSMPVTVWTDTGLGETDEPLQIAADRPILASLEGVSLAPATPAARYVLPATAEELTASCGVEGITLVVSEPGLDDRTVACDPSGPTAIGPLSGAPPPDGDADQPTLGAGTVVASLDGRTFELSMVASGVSSTVHGFTTARPAAWPEPVSSRFVEGLLPTTGAWTPAAIATAGGAVGAVDLAVSLPVTDSAVTSVSVSISDGSTETTIDLAATDADVAAALAGDGVVSLERVVALPTSMDGAAALATTVTFDSGDRKLAPTLRSLTISHDLPEVALGPDQTIASSIVDGPVLRLAADSTLAAGSTLTASAVEGTPGITLSSGTIEPGAVVLIEADGAGGTFDLTVRHGASGVLTLRRITLTP